jgi:beta-lactamase class A
MITALRRSWLVSFLLIFLGFVSAAQAQTEPPFTQRAHQIPAVLSGQTKATDVFTPAFLAAVPASQIEGIATQLAAQYGAVGKVEAITAASPTSGTIDIGYEKAVISMTMTLEDSPPHKIIGLQITGMKARGDSAAKLDVDFRALPGRSGILVRRLNDPNPRAPPLLSINAGERFAIGSAFKLWVLAEASRAIAAGERRWSDVVPLGPKSLPSGMTQNWPSGSLVTLQTLATLMISISDNTATDTLIRALGRPKVDAAVAMTGHSRPELTTPVLTTNEAFALKVDANADLRRAYVGGSLPARRTLLNANQRRLATDTLPLAKFAAAPLFIDQIEWFASPLDLSNTLDWFRRAAGPETRAILAVNAGIAPGDAARFGYVGYKGGSEVGVISMNLLIQTKAGVWYSVTASWNDTAAGVDELRFVSLVSRAVALIP